MKSLQWRLRIGLLARPALLAGCLVVMTAQCAAQSSIVVDSDADLDDYRAVAALARTGRLSVVIVTVGISRSSEGAGAMGRS
jgi:hypothetical protein